MTCSFRDYCSYLVCCEPFLWRVNKLMTWHYWTQGQPVGYQKYNLQLIHGVVCIFLIWILGWNPYIGNKPLINVPSPGKYLRYLVIDIPIHFLKLANCYLKTTGPKSLLLRWRCKLSFQSLREVELSCPLLPLLFISAQTGSSVRSRIWIPIGRQQAGRWDGAQLMAAGELCTSLHNLGD